LAMDIYGNTNKKQSTDPRDRRASSLAVYSFVFRDSAPKAPFQNSLGQAKAGFGP